MNNGTVSAIKFKWPAVIESRLAEQSMFAHIRGYLLNIDCILDSSVPSIYFQTILLVSVPIIVFSVRAVYMKIHSFTLERIDYEKLSDKSASIAVLIIYTFFTSIIWTIA